METADAERVDLQHPAVERTEPVERRAQPHHLAEHIGSMPPAVSICIIIDVPDLGRPETTTMAGPYRARRIARRAIAIGIE